MAELVAGQKSHTSGEKQRRQEIALLAGAQILDRRIVGGSLHAVVPRMIVGVAVAIFLAIRFVVLVIVRYEIIQVEPVMRRNEIDAGPRPAPALVEEVTRYPEMRAAN